MKIECTKWKVVEKDGQKAIAGEFSVKAGASVVAKQEFNDGYNSVNIAFPTEIMLAVETVGKQITDHIQNHFTE